MKVALSTTTEAKYIALSTTLRDVIQVMQLLNKLVSITIPMRVPTVWCKVFEDNVGAIELAKCPKLPPCAKQIDIQYNHVRTRVAKKLITSIQHVTMTEQAAGIATKPLPHDQFKYLDQQLLGWSE
jgi:hypothetical protein